MNLNTLQLYAVIPQTQSLGLGTRFAIWVQGCPFRCENCMTPNSLPLDAGQTIDLSQLTQWIIETPEIEGITISGGEPFLQAAGLSELIQRVQQERDLGVICYSGYTLEHLQRLGLRLSSIRNFLTKIDALIDGQYVDHLNDGLSLRGSSNQKLHLLSSRYSDLAFAQHQRTVEVHLQEQDIMLVGIPTPAFLQQWQQRLTK